MGCNCGSKQSAVKYIYTSTKGTQHTYRTLMEARAAQIREGRETGGKTGAIREEAVK